MWGGFSLCAETKGEGLSCDSLLRFALPIESGEWQSLIVANPKPAIEEKRLRGRDTDQDYQLVASFDPGLGNIIFNFVPAGDSAMETVPKAFLALPIRAPEFELSIPFPFHQNQKNYLDGNLLRPVFEFLRSQLREDESVIWSVAEPAFTEFLVTKTLAELRTMGIRAKRVPIFKGKVDGLEGFSAGAAEVFLMVEDHVDIELVLGLVKDGLFLSSLGQDFPLRQLLGLFDAGEDWAGSIEIDSRHDRTMSFRERSDETWELYDLSSFSGKPAAEVLRQQNGYLIRVSYRLRLQPK